MKQLLIGLIALGSMSGFASERCSVSCVVYTEPFKFIEVGFVEMDTFEKLGTGCEEIVSKTVRTEGRKLIQTNPQNFGIGVGDENLTFHPEGGASIKSDRIVFSLLIEEEVLQPDGSFLLVIVPATSSNSCKKP